MTRRPPTIATLIGAFAEPERRAQATAALAAALGCESCLIFAPDPEIGILLPASGLPQTLPHAREWRRFLERCVAEGEFSGELPGLDGRRVPARGVADTAVLVVLGERVEAVDLAALVPALPLLGALFTSERRSLSTEVRLAAARDAVNRAESLARALREMRERLEQALREAESARGEAIENARQAESLSDELRAQAEQLEVLNEDLAMAAVEAERARVSADSANRAKSEFLATMSHELRTPLNAIIGYAELLQMGISGEVSPEQRAQLERIRASSRHLLTLINDVLDLAKIEAGQMTFSHQEFPPAIVVEDAVALFGLQASDLQIDLSNECDVEGHRCVADPDRVRQIVTNLVSNAIKFTEPGGRVTIRCGTTVTPPTNAELKGSGPWAWVEVEDDGIGIDAEDRARIFRPFIQADGGHVRKRGGTGLGLTISRQLARLMAGDLTVWSQPGMGSRFTLWLPTREEVGSLDEAIRVEFVPRQAS